MKNKDSIKKELSNANIDIKDNGICHYKYDKISYTQPVDVAAKSFHERAKYCVIVFNELWNHICKIIKENSSNNVFPGNNQTQRIFINAVLNLYRITKRYKIDHENILPYVLSKDSDVFPEGLMIEFIDNYLCIQWLYSLIKRNESIHALLSKWSEMTVNKEASGQMGHVDLSMEERVYPESENEHDEQEMNGMLHPLYTRKFQQFDIQHGMNVYDIEDRIHRLINDPYEYNRGDERQPNRSSRNMSNSDA